MKKTIKLALAATLALSATSAFATNGSNLIATGSQARSMGGTGIGISHGAESGLANVALITSVEKTEVSFGGMFFMPDVSNTNGLNLGQLGDESGTSDSAADLNVIPEVSIATKLNDNLYLGMGIWGTAGMGVDYRTANSSVAKTDTDPMTGQLATEPSGQMNMVTNLQLMQFAFPLAYKKNALSIGVTPILQYGSLDINYHMSRDIQKAMTMNIMSQAGTYSQEQITAAMDLIKSDKNVGTGVAQDLQFGYNLGLAYETHGLTLGAMYKSQIDMSYADVLPSAIGAMGVNYTNKKLSTPAEMGLGGSYKYGKNTIALDFKVIKWASAKGYQDFGWEDQKVTSLGYEYATKGWSLRAGYNYASTQIKEQTATNSAKLSAGLVNTFNTLGFPGIMKSHYTFGGSLDINEQTKIILAYVYAPKETISFKNFLGQKSTTSHTQSSASFDIVYDF